VPLPEPQRGLVISYSYLWHHEHRAGRDEGRKNRPCVIVVAAESDKDGAIIIRVVPVTHTPPDNSAAGIELPAVVKRHLGLDDQRS
jgi:hypothetical protein